MTYQMLASFSRYVFIYAYVSLNRIYGFHGYQLSNKESVPQYLEYEPWVDNPNLGEASLQFEFKTNVANGVLMTVSDGDKGMHKLRLSLNDGKLHVYLMMGESDQLRKKEISVGKQWNDMKWHSVKLTRRFRFVTLSIDNMEETISSDGESPDRLTVDSNLFIGLDPDQSNLIEGFTGCIINISYPIGTQPKPPQFVRGDVKDECDDECTDSENECLNGGKCIKKLDNSKSVCDCGGTGMKGKFCSEPELVAYFDGNTFVSFPTQPLENFRNNRIQFRFRTNEPFGIIAFGGNTHRHVVIELYRGNIQANISLGADNVVVSAGNNALHDGEWHSVIIERSGTEIVLSVDRESYPESYVDEKHFKYQPPSRCTEDVEERLNLMVGGHPYANTLAISTSKKNYQGCLQQVLFDSHNSEIIKLAKYPNIYRIIEGQIRFSCPVTPQKVKKFEKSDISTLVNRNTQTQLQTKSKSRLSQNTVAWITGGICVGSIALILTLACGFNKIRKKYSGQFLAQKSGKFLHTREALEKINGRVAKEFYLISSRDTSPRIFESPFRRDGHGAVV